MGIFDLSQEQLVNLGISAAIIAAAVVFGRLLVNLVLGGIVKRITGRTSSKLDDAIIAAVKAPAYWLLLVRWS
jgi:hypothetical protein